MPTLGLGFPAGLAIGGKPTPGPAHTSPPPHPPRPGAARAPGPAPGPTPGSCRAGGRNSRSLRIEFLLTEQEGEEGRANHSLPAWSQETSSLVSLSFLFPRRFQDLLSGPPVSRKEGFVGQRRPQGQSPPSPQSRLFICCFLQAWFLLGRGCALHWCADTSHQTLFQGSCPPGVGGGDEGKAVPCEHLPGKLGRPPVWQGTSECAVQAQGRQQAGLWQVRPRRVQSSGCRAWLERGCMPSHQV